MDLFGILEHVEYGIDLVNLENLAALTTIIQCC